ncbi:divergent AAA domain protein [Selenomonas sputigena ATCC 35185]|uniref:Divergent AAA domain protein n=2 Tax=Selenomonas sputigena (strain ATCC 35185 / DSM 20758 / CCUG 44933 / VPI D19B-28) TaxID=546271 RepID=C9LT25_SELS3|nr:divergent AAA domain protein [Selenomonas sputigena ATCC 35185]
MLNVQEEMTGVRGDFVEQIVAESGSFLNTAVAFANGRGGRIIFYGESGRGFSAEAELIPCIDEITQKIFDSCEPRIFPRVGVELQDGRQVVVVEIFPGMEKPYFVKELGMMDGTYVRVGGATRLAEPYQVQELLLSGTNSSADQLAAESTVSDVEIEEFCRMMYGEAEKRRADDDVVRLQKEDLLAWKLLREEAGECRATGGWHLLAGTAEELFPEGFIQCAEYLGATRLDFVGGEEFAGSLTEQVDGAANYVQERLLARGLKARGLEELPEDLMRRLLARAVCQRNYAAPGRISLVLYEDRLEITVPGLLEEDMTIWKLKTGFSKIRNRAIAAAFLYMGMMTGFQSILPELYRAAKRARLPEPAVITLGDSVRINLYCRAEEEAQQQESVVEETELVQTVEAAEEAEPVQEQELVGEAELVQDVEPVEIVEPVQEQDPVEETELAEEAESVQEVEPIEEAEPIREEEPLPEEIEEEQALLQEESGAGDVLASGISLEDGQDARLVQEVEADHEPDLEPAPELKLELESLADLKADDVALEEEPTEPREEKVSAGQQELSFAVEESAEAMAEESAKEIVKEVLEKPVEVSSEESMEERLLHVIRENPKVTQKALKEALGVSIATVKRMTTALHKAGVIERTGTNRSGEWHILKD